MTTTKINSLISLKKCIYKISQYKNPIISVTGSCGKTTTCKMVYELLQNKYRITNLVNVIHNRTDRQALERIMGLLFCQEFPQIMKVDSLFGDILSKKNAFNYDYKKYYTDFTNKKLKYPFVKVWTGR